MPIRYSLLEHPGVLLFSYEGTTNNAQQFALYRAFREEYSLTHSLPSVVDMSGMKSTEINGSEMFAQAARSQREASKSEVRVKQALYAPTEITYGIARMYQGFAELSQDIEVQIFEDLQKALEWVGVEGRAEDLFVTEGWSEVDENGTVRPASRQRISGVGGGQK